jgi:hypothetical protein
MIDLILYLIAAICLALAGQPAGAGAVLLGAGADAACGGGGVMGEG